MAAAGTAPASAGVVLDRIHGTGVLRCGAAARAGFAEATAASAAGLGVELCRAVAIAVLGPDATVAVTVLESAKDYDAVRSGAEDLVFLTGGDAAEQALAAMLVPGPTVFVDPLSVLVPTAAPVKGVSDLAGQPVCLITGSPAQRALEAAAARQHLAIARMAFQEDVEMYDAYAVGQCRAMVGFATELGPYQAPFGINRLASRLLQEPLALVPVIAATGTQDGSWSALAFWLLQAIVQDGGSAALPAGALAPRPAWRSDIAQALGSYADMVRRTVGADSPLRLAPGVSAPWPAGVLLPPAVE